MHNFCMFENCNDIPKTCNTHVIQIFLCQVCKHSLLDTVVRKKYSIVSCITCWDAWIRKEPDPVWCLCCWKKTTMKTKNELQSDVCLSANQPHTDAYYFRKTSAFIELNSFHLKGDKNLHRLSIHSAQSVALFISNSTRYLGLIKKLISFFPKYSLTRALHGIS